MPRAGVGEHRGQLLRRRPRRERRGASDAGAQRAEEHRGNYSTDAPAQIATVSVPARTPSRCNAAATRSISASSAP